MAQWRKANGKDYSITEAARALGIKDQVAYHLVRHGLLECGAAPQRRARRISNNDLAAFKARYISLVEIAKRLGTSPKQILNSLQACPVAGPSIDGCRQYFYSRSDLAHLLPQPIPQAQEPCDAEP